MTALNKDRQVDFLDNADDIEALAEVKTAVVANRVATITITVGGVGTVTAIVNRLKRIMALLPASILVIAVLLAVSYER